MFTAYPVRTCIRQYDLFGKQPQVAGRLYKQALEPKDPLLGLKWQYLIPNARFLAAESGFTFASEKLACV